ncbi:hypothetical protein IB286_13065 [Spongiibacter sp. KMU-158]|uniref:SMP-30/Gluconolactonase/LRE-like region domain-containing protein n=1 Tax=Spongiibacter pelagi TaxID=2760804 RepID=A0A927C277_9GAMM|nr:hypothetical protein [Spongiibacter pelagi]MBD2859933.1 hypothetical protein [Spongiibacter pelagi]
MTLLHSQLLRILALPALVFGLTACDGSIHNAPCDAVDNATPYCGLQAPEDIESTPDGRYLILSHFGGLTSAHSGSIGLFDTLDSSHRTLFPLDQNQDMSSTELWGDENCITPPAASFSPHGIHLSQRGDQRWQLLVVNHGNREAVEFFEWLPNSKEILWRGCAQFPEGSYLNDVVASPEGGLLVSHMFDKHSKLELIQSLFGSNHGHVWYWRRNQMPEVLMGSEGSFANGLQISPDGRYLFINMWADGEVVKVDRRSGTVLGRVSISYPDNSAWLQDGRLLVTSQEMGGFLPTICTSVENSYCPSPFKLVAVDPDTLESEILYRHEGAPMGAGTVGVQNGKDIYVGSYAGDRLLRVSFP